MPKLSRRSLVTSAAALPALSVPAAAVTDGDQKLRQLWAKYLSQVATERAVYEKFRLARAAYKDAAPPRPDGVDYGHHYDTLLPLRVHYGVERLYDAWNAVAEPVCETIKEIQAIEADTLFGIGVKLAAVPHFDDPQVSASAAIAALEDIDRSLGTGFASNLETAIGWDDKEEEEDQGEV